MFIRCYSVQSLLVSRTSMEQSDHRPGNNIPRKTLGRGAIDLEKRNLQKMVKLIRLIRIVPALIGFMGSFVCQSSAFGLQAAAFRSNPEVRSDVRNNLKAAIAAKVVRSKDRISMTASSPGNSWLSVFCPLLKLIGDSDPTKPRNLAFEIATSGFASLSRLPWGSEVSPQAAARASIPSKVIRVYEFEACPFCRRVRETITFLDLQVEVIPCPKGSILHRSEVEPHKCPIECE